MPDRVWRSSLQVPIQAVLSMGLAGEVLNPIQVPSQWTKLHWAPVGLAVQNIIPGMANAGIRLFRYTIRIIGLVAGANFSVTTCYNGNIANYIMYHTAVPPAAAAIPTLCETIDFGPGGIAWGLNQSFDVATPAAGAFADIICQYSYEPTASNVDGI